MYTKQQNNRRNVTSKLTDGQLERWHAIQIKFDKIFSFVLTNRDNPMAGNKTANNSGVFNSSTEMRLYFRFR